jgi:Flp pilus assembly pilin Flp
MSTVAALALALLAVVMLVNLANGTLGAWLKAKFLHMAPPATTSAVAA